MWPWRDRYPFVRRAIVSLKTGRVFRGVLWEQRAEFLVMRQVEQLKDPEVRASQVIPIDGELALPRENVEFVQVLGAVE